MSKKIFIGTDSGATTTKFSAVWENGEAISTKLLQRPTSSEKGRAAVISGWISGIGEFLAQNNLQWSQVHGVGLAIPGPYERYGVFGKTPNLPASFSGWGVYSDYSAALGKQAARAWQHQGVRDDAHARLRPRRGIRRHGRTGAGRRHDCRDGSRPHARRAPPARHHRQTVPVRLRSRLGLCGSLHDYFRPAVFARGKTFKVSRPRTRQVHRDAKRKRAFPPQPRAKSRRARRGDF